MLVLTALVSAVIVEIARLLRHLVARIDRAVAKRMQQRAARWTVAAIVTAGLLIVSVFVARSFANWADTNFGTFDGTTADGVEPPTSPTVLGKPGVARRLGHVGIRRAQLRRRRPDDRRHRVVRP
jgi:uncharacterized membrane protein